MSTELPTIADPTLLDEESLGALSRLVVYVEDDGHLASQIVKLPEGVEVTVGRSRGCTVHVDSERISRRHAALRRTGSTIQVTDLGSRNGTRINGELISEPTALRPGDELSIGPMSAVLTSAVSVRWRPPLSGDAELHERLEAEVDRCNRYHRRFALAMIRVEGEDDAVDAAIDRITGRLRPMDFAADYGPGELAVLLPELGEAAASETVERLVMATSPPGGAAAITARAGIAVFPRHGSTGAEIVDRARAALRGARSERRQTMLGSAGPTRPDDDVVAISPATRRLFALLAKVAATPVTVLIVGETGSGKEISAAAIHRRSPRAAGPFVKLNCACLPSTLLESELFGYEKGAFTGADRQKRGFFEAASGGTLFLDEIGEIDGSLQAKLLRVLESKTIMRVGGTREISVDVRVLCATNRDLEVEVAAERFRADLYYRIAGFTVVVPPLRERSADIGPLAERFLTEIAAELDGEPPVLAPETREALESYAWPGNIRELRNAVERAVVLCSGGVIEVEDLPPALAAGRDRAILSGRRVRTESGLGVRDQLAEVERAAICEALEATGGNQTRAARELGLTRRALIYRMEKYGIKRKAR
jgi:DNA-binding NtrC family response regulator